VQNLGTLFGDSLHLFSLRVKRLKIQKIVSENDANKLKVCVLEESARPLKEYDRARPSSAENSQQELALHQANLRANIAAPEECQDSHAACTVAVPAVSARQVLKL
jgi:hypothetical protein